MLATQYPEALAMVVASHSRASLSARRWFPADLNACRACVGQAYEISRQPSPARRYTLPAQLAL